MLREQVPNHSSLIYADANSFTRDILQGIFQPLITNINDLVKAQVDSVRIKRMEESHAKSKEIKVGLSIFCSQRSSHVEGDLPGWRLWIQRLPARVSEKSSSRHSSYSTI